MIDAMLERHSIDRSRVYVVGFSAGGATTAVMLAAYPERFAGGAIITGVPYGCADTASRPSGRLTAMIWRMRLRVARALGQSTLIGRNLSGRPGVEPRSEWPRVAGLFLHSFPFQATIKLACQAC